MMMSLKVNGGNDVIKGGQGKDYIKGGTGNDKIYGMAKKMVQINFYGGSGLDEL